MADRLDTALERPLPFSAWHFAALLGVFLFAAFPKVILGQHSFFFRDYGVLGYPFIAYYHESFWMGELPLWNPFSNCGTPFLAQWGTMVLYPFSIIYLLFPLPWSLGYFCLAHLFLAGLGMYLLAREWTRNDFAAAFAGVAYVFNGVTFSSLIWPNYTVALGWMPFVVLCSQRAWRAGGRNIPIAAVVGTMQMLSGVPELVLLTWLVVGGLWLADVCRRRGNESQISLVQRLDIRDWLPRLLQTAALRLGCVVVLIAGLSAVQLLPFFDLLAHSQRSRDFATSKWAMPGWGWANLLVPLFHTFKSYQGPCFQHGQAFMTSYYPGVAVLVLAGWAAWSVRTARVWVLGSLLLLSWILALGENGFVFAWIKERLPVIGFARFPIKFVLLGAFVLPLLSAFALASLGPAILQRRRQSLLTAIALVVALIVGIAWFARQYPYPMQEWTELWRNTTWRVIFFLLILGGCCAAVCAPKLCYRRIFGISAVALILADVLTHTEQQNPTIATSWFSKGLWQERNGTTFGRVFISPEAEQRLLRSTVRDPVHDFVGKRLALWSNLNIVDGVPKVNGSSTLRLREQDMLERALYLSNAVAPPKGILDFLGVTHVTGSNPVEWAVRPSALAVVTAGQQPTFLPEQEQLQAVLRDDFEPRTTVCLPQELRSAVHATDTNATVTGLRLEAQRVSFSVAAEGDAMVVIAQSYHPAWRARIDGKPAALWRANYAFQALQVPAGKHQVTIEYKDNKLIAGTGISALAALLCLGIWRRSRHNEWPSMSRREQATCTGSPTLA